MNARLLCRADPGLPGEQPWGLRRSAETVRKLWMIATLEAGRQLSVTTSNIARSNQALGLLTSGFHNRMANGVNLIRTEFGIDRQGDDFIRRGLRLGV